METTLGTRLTHRHPNSEERPGTLQIARPVVNSSRIRRVVLAVPSQSCGVAERATMAMTGSQPRPSPRHASRSSPFGGRAAPRKFSH